ncbi:MAG: hypothetical protein GY729_02680 [Desulfobacteraceae bacterium]|nr:hypothetical protein [Desulfobacteraceae bacterium]
MKSVQVDYDKESKTITSKNDAKTEDWVSVCQKFNDDVERIMDVENQEDYTGLYLCCDDDNQPFYYLVKEDKDLFKIRRRHFMDNLGLT